MQHTVYLFEGFQLDVTRRRLVSSGGNVLSLNSRAIEALLLLVSNAGELVEKRRLMETVWPNAVVEDNNLNQCILAIRKALGEVAGSNRYVMTVPGRGYRFVSPVREMVQESVADTVTATALPTRPQVALWPGITAVALAACAIVGVLFMKLQTFEPTVVAELAQANAPGSATIVLHLATAGDNGAGSASAPLAFIAECLALKNDMKLRVQLQLLASNGEQAWVGNFAATAQASGELKSHITTADECGSGLTALKLSNTPGREFATAD